MTDTERKRQPYTTTHDSIPAENGRNDGDGTSGDCISRTQAIYEIHEDADWLAAQGSDWQTERMERDKSILMSLPSVQPDIIRCKDCKWYGRADKRRFYRDMDCLQKRIDTIVPDRDFCSKAERREQNG